MFRSDLWAAAFVRRHNDIGHICVVSRKGDPIAGQIFIEIDHLNGVLFIDYVSKLKRDRVIRKFVKAQKLGKL